MTAYLPFGISQNCMTAMIYSKDNISNTLKNEMFLCMNEQFEVLTMFS